jgi:hypothetical protein
MSGAISYRGFLKEWPSGGLGIRLQVFTLLKPVTCSLLPSLSEWLTLFENRCKPRIGGSNPSGRSRKARKSAATAPPTRHAPRRLSSSYAALISFILSSEYSLASGSMPATLSG